jgi:GT2 family glycosyltransferase
VLVVDNASGDDSVPRLQAAVQSRGWQTWAQVIAAPRNGGFAYGNNVGIRAALTQFPRLPYLLLLNPDTLARPGALSTLLAFVKARPEVGMAGGISEDPDGTRQHCSFRFPSPAGELANYAQVGLLDRLLHRWTILAGKPSEPERVDWVSGAFVLIRREVVDQIGLLDEGYFLYFEETDFLLRAQRAGWQCWHVPAARVVHLVGQSSGINDAQGSFKALPPYWFESRRRYFILNHGRAYAIGVDIATLCGAAIARVKGLVQRRKPAHPPNLVPDLLRLGAIRQGRASLKPRMTGL